MFAQTNLIERRLWCELYFDNMLWVCSTSTSVNIEMEMIGGGERLWHQHEQEEEDGVSEEVFYYVEGEREMVIVTWFGWCNCLTFI